MNNNLLFILTMLVLGLAAIVIFLWLQIRSLRPSEEQAISDDKLETSAVSPFQFSGLNQSDANLIRAAINRMGGVGDNAEEEYQQSLKALQSDSLLVVQALGRELEVLPASDFLNRWSLIQLLCDLQNPDSLSLLDKLLSSTMPAELFRDPHSRSSLRQETINLTTAVEALTRLAEGPNSSDALGCLRKHITHKSLSVRRACIQGYLAHAGENARSELSELLPKADHYLLDIRRLTVQEIPRIKIDEKGLPIRNTPKTTDSPRVTPHRD